MIPNTEPEKQVSSEIEHFFFIDNHIEKIMILNNQLYYENLDGDKDVTLQEELDLTANELQLAVKNLSQYGVTIYAEGEFIDQMAEFKLWYDWWSEYAYSLPENELSELKSKLFKGLDLSEWRPEGSWKN